MSLPELRNLIQLLQAMTPPIVSSSSPPTGGKGYRYFNKRLHKLVDFIDLKVDEGVPKREVRKIEPTTKDISKMKYEQIQESNGEETPRQEESG
jgi:DNA-binding transcriptional MerR regulator